MINNAASGQSVSSGVFGNTVTDEQMQRAYHVLGLSFTTPNSQGRSIGSQSGKIFALNLFQEGRNNIILQIKRWKKVT